MKVRVNKKNISLLGANNHHHYFDVKSLHWDMNFYSSSKVCLGFLLTLSFLTLSVWNRICRSRAPNDFNVISEQSFYWLCALVVLYLVLALMELGLARYLRTQKEKFWPAAQEPGVWTRGWHRLRGFFAGLSLTPSFWSYWFCTQIPAGLIHGYLRKFRIMSKSRIRRNVWFCFFIPVLIPPVILNYEVMVTGTVKYFYASLALTLIPLVLRLALSIKQSLGFALTVQAFRRDHRIRIIDFCDPGTSEFLVQVLELIPWDLEKKFIDQWKLGTRIQTQVILWQLIRKKHSWKVQVLRFSLLILGWMVILMQTQIGYV